MSKRVVIIVQDDYTGKERGDVETYSFTWLDGTEYEIDLAKSSVKAAEKAFEDFLNVARPVKKKRRSPTKKAAAKASGGTGKTAAMLAERKLNNEIREWARQNGHDVSSRGVIPQEIRDAHEQWTQSVEIEG